MSRTSRNFVVAYILLVGLPLLGLVGVLRSGRRLTAPLSVDGTWKIEADARSIAGHACTSLPTLLTSPLVLSQSGRDLEVSFKGKLPSPGTLDNNNLKSSIPVAGDPSCGNSVMLAAVVDPLSEPRSLAGQFSFPECSGCAPVEFRAVRQPKSQGGGAH